MKPKTKKDVADALVALKPGEVELYLGNRVKIVKAAKWRPPPGPPPRRSPLKGCVAYEHYDNKKRLIGLECVSTMEHWWLDEGIERRELQVEDYDFRALRTRDKWQIPWAWQYECWREWQPQSEFERCRNEWRKEVKRYRDPSVPSFCGERTPEDTESDAAFTYGGRLPLWLLRDFAKYFPDIPWLKIPPEKRDSLKDEPPPSNYPPVSLEGSLLELKEDPPETTGPPFDGEDLNRYREWLQGPGHYAHEVVREIAPGHFVGTYVIEIPWNRTESDLEDGFRAWRKKHAPKKGDYVRVPDNNGRRFAHTTHNRETQEMTGKEKPLAKLQQLGALRLWRDRKAEAAVGGTMPYKHKGSLLAAKNDADLKLAAFFGQA